MRSVGSQTVLGICIFVALVVGAVTFLILLVTAG